MLKTREELSVLRQTLEGRFASQVKKILVCAGTGCVAGGSLDIYARLVELLQGKGIHCQVDLAHEPHGDDVGVKRSGCHGFCEMGPLVRIEPQGWLYIKVKKDDCQEIIEKTVNAFAGFGITPEQISAKLNKDIDKLSNNDIVKLRHLYSAIKDGFVKATDAFGIASSSDAALPSTDEENALEALNKKLAKSREKNSGTDA